MHNNPLEIELYHRLRQDCYSTAYPWKPEDWSPYIKPGKLKFKNNGTLSFYIHIPFCTNLCKFCEYTRCILPDDKIQRIYLQTLHSDIRRFLNEYPDITLEGLDIGGGTPTALSLSNFAYLMQIYKEVIGSVNKSDDFEPSIEASFKTITPEKISMIHEAGIKRISIGIQSLYFSRYQSGIGWRYPEAEIIINRIKEIRRPGDFKINLDFMYGFKFQGYDKTDKPDKTVIEQLAPDQVTLYELRTNQLIDYEGAGPGLRSENYDRWFRTLDHLGYQGRYGQNTFSTDRDDLGVSSYIRHRMLEGNDYKGFGISAQSMSDGNIEYNVGKNVSDILSLIPSKYLSEYSTFEATEHYDLPIAEKFAKFVCISAYSGGFNWRIAKERFYPDFFERFGKVLDFLLKPKYESEAGDIELSNNRINVTRHGFYHYGPLFSLFYKPELTITK